MSYAEMESMLQLVQFFFRFHKNPADINLHSRNTIWLKLYKEGLIGLVRAWSDADIRSEKLID